MTDGDLAIAAACKIAFPSILHIVCIWHIVAKNAFKNLSKLLCHSDVKKLQSMLWDFCLKEDTANEGFYLFIHFLFIEY